MRWIPVLFGLLFSLSATWAGEVSSGADANRVEILPVQRGARLITFFRAGIPQVSVLEDTLNSPRTDAHRFRQVWALSYVKPNWKQRAAAALPFFYHRVGASPGSLRNPPPPLLNVSDPGAGTAGRIGAWALQFSLLDDKGIGLRATSRSYRGNADDYHDLYVERCLEILDDGLREAEFDEESTRNWDLLNGRLMLSERILGGLVSSEAAARFSLKTKTESEEERASNWELLRQAAEKNGLYFEPVANHKNIPDQAMLWMARRDLEEPGERVFDPTFLGIANPWTDLRIRDWRGYEATWYLDAEGQISKEETPGTKATRMVPLAMYSLEYPRVPLLLVDFRDSWNAKRREMFRRAATEVTAGVLGITGYGHLTYMAASGSYRFVRDRHGAAMNRSRRLGAYARLRQDLFEGDGGFDAQLRMLLQNRLDEIALNPFEQSTEAETLAARRQYRALVGWATSANGLVRLLEKDRQRELSAMDQGVGERVLRSSLRTLSFGFFGRPLEVTPERLEALHRSRVLASDVDALQRAEQVPNFEVVWDINELRRRAEETVALAPPNSDPANLASRILLRLKAGQDPEVKQAAAGAGQ